jgi:uncharacterized phosphosugar-binding protein
MSERFLPVGKNSGLITALRATHDSSSRETSSKKVTYDKNDLVFKNEKLSFQTNHGFL